MTNELSQLVWSLKNGDLDEVKKILNSGKYDINQEIEGRPLIHFAADYGQVEILSYLLQKGADINKCDKHGITALLAAIWENHIECVRLCLSSGADKDLKTPDGKTYLEAAAETPEIRSLLV